MLVLSRTPTQQIQIGDNVTVTVLRIKGNQIKIGIEAPRDVRVIRAELPPRELSSVAAETDDAAAELTITEHDQPGALPLTRSTRSTNNRGAGVDRGLDGFSPVTSPRS